MLAVCWPYAGLMSARSRSVVVSLPYVGYMLAICWPYVGHRVVRVFDVCSVAVFLPYFGLMAAVQWPYVGRILVLCWPYIGLMFAICRSYVSHILSPYVRSSLYNV